MPIFFFFFFFFFCWLLSNYWQRTFYLNFEVSLLNNNGKTKKSDVTFFIGSFLFFLPLCIWFKMDAHDNDEKVKPKNWKISSSSSIKNSEQKKKCQYFFCLEKIRAHMNEIRDIKEYSKTFFLNMKNDRNVSAIQKFWRLFQYLE